MNSILNSKPKRSFLKLPFLLFLFAIGCASPGDQSDSPLFDSSRPVIMYASSKAEYRVELEMQAIDNYYTAFRVRTTNAVENCQDSLSGILHLADTLTGNAEIREDDFNETVFAESLMNEDQSCGFAVDRDIEGGYRVWLSVYDCPRSKTGCEFDAGSSVFYKQGERLGEELFYGFMPASRTRLLTEADLAAFPDWGLMRNEIFARQGHPFKTERYQWIFGERTDWYQPKDSAITAEDLSDIEHKNVVFLQNLEAEGYSGFRSFLAALTVGLTEDDQSAISRMIAPHLMEDIEIVFPEEGVRAFQNNEYRVRWNRDTKQKELIIGNEAGAQLQYYFDKLFDESGKGRWMLRQMLAVG